MRITGGEVKGRRLASFRGMNIRPTADRVREAIFNIIGQNLSGLKVLDLFAGTGSMGLESLSRGAQQAVFVDKSQQAINLIKKNIELCGYQTSGVTLKKNLDKAIPISYPLPGKIFDLVFIDPPYRKNMASFLLAELSLCKMLSSETLVVVESFKTEILPSSIENLLMEMTRLYGDTRISIYRFEARNE